MPTIVACPKCRQQVTLPPDPSGGLICPHCMAEFAMQPVLRSSDQYSSLRHELAREVRQNVNGSRQSGVTFAEVGDSVIALPNRRAPSGLAMMFHFIGLVGGGALGLAVGYCLLTWIGGTHFNVLELPLPWLTPVAKRGEPDVKVNDVAARPAGQSKTGDVPLQAAKSAKPLSQASHTPAPSTDSRAHDVVTQTADRRPVGTESRVAESQSVDSNRTAWRDHDASGDATDALAVVEANARHTKVTFSAHQETESSRNASRLTAEELAGAVKSAREAISCSACKATGVIKRTIAGREVSQRCEVCRGLRGPGITAEIYGKLCRLAEVSMDYMTSSQRTESSKDYEKVRDEIAAIWRTAIDRPEKQAAVGRHAAMRYREPSPGSSGILLVGTVERKEGRGAFQATRIVLLGDPTPVTILSRGELPCRTGDKVIIPGTIMSQPDRDLPGYTGPTERVVRADHSLRLEE